MPYGFEYNKLNLKPNFKLGSSAIEKAIGKAKKYKGIEDKFGERYEQFTNFDSDYYEQYRDYLNKTTPQITANALLAPLMASGVGYNTGQKLAMTNAKGMNRETTDKINTGVQGFALGSQEMGNNMLQAMMNNEQWMMQFQEMKRQFDESQPGIFGSLLNIGAGIAGQGVGNLMSGKSFFGGSTGGGYKDPNPNK